MSLSGAICSLGSLQSSDCKTISGWEATLTLWCLENSCSDFLADCKGLINRSPLSSTPFVHRGLISPVWAPMGLAGHHSQTGPEKSISSRAYLVARCWRICLQCRRPGFDPWVGKIPWKVKRLPTSVLLPGEFHGQWSLAAVGGVAESVATEQLTLALDGLWGDKTTALIWAVCIFLSVGSVFLAISLLLKTD